MSPRELGPTPWKNHPSVAPRFYSHRADHEKRKPRSADYGRGIFRRRSRSLTLSLFDLIIVGALFVIVTFVVIPLQARGRIGSYRLTIEAEDVDEIIYIELTVQDRAARAQTQPGAPSVVEAEILGQTLRDLVPMVEAERVLRMSVLRSELEDPDGPIRAFVRIGEETVSLSAGIR